MTVIDPETMNCITFEGREEPLEFNRILEKPAGIRSTRDVPRPMVSKEVLAATTGMPFPIGPEKISLGGGPCRPPRLSWRYARRPLELEGDQAWNRREKRHQKKRMVLLVPRL